MTFASKLKRDYGSKFKAAPLFPLSHFPPFPSPLKVFNYLNKGLLERGCCMLYSVQIIKPFKGLSDFQLLIHQRTQGLENITYNKKSDSANSW